MEHKPRPGSGGMEGGGAYNRHAKFQADGGNLALLLIQEAAENIEVGNEPIVIADYGSSQGRNSLKPIRAAIDALHRRLGSGQPILVYHIDLPVNDFSSLFKTLDADADSYSASLPNIYPCAVGRSFYESVLPAGCVHIGWSAYAVQWLSRIPSVPVDHFWFTRLNAAARAIYERQAAKDWESFLAFRASELRPGGRLVVVCPGVGDCQTIADQVDPVIADMVNEKAISREERARMVIASWQRSEREYLAPFHRDA